jgi:hypothetical protein
MPALLTGQRQLYTESERQPTVDPDVLESTVYFVFPGMSSRGGVVDERQTITDP